MQGPADGAGGAGMAQHAGNRSVGSDLARRHQPHQPVYLLKETGLYRRDHRIERWQVDVTRWMLCG